MLLMMTCATVWFVVRFCAVGGCCGGSSSAGATTKILNVGMEILPGQVHDLREKMKQVMWESAHLLR